ncbi:MAG: hypothetical protein B6I20_03870 [Bacteroidetes bacterium 4572_117]|nr:MAG: hypothetical protein B6I20_03870 [Bacteroidetes bacterium 4572_117]
MIYKFIKILIIIGFVSFQQTRSQTIEIPSVQYVSVDVETQKIHISWQINDPSKIDGYIIKRQIFGQPDVVDGTFNTIKTINDPNQLTYIDNGDTHGYANPKNRAETYRIAAYKNNGGVIEYGNMSISLSSILLNQITFDQCNKTNTLKWSQYTGFLPENSNYYIYYWIDTNLPPILIDSVTNGGTSYTHNNVIVDTSYHYLVQAYSKNTQDKANSNTLSANTLVPGIPQIMNANYATVKLSNQVDISFTVDENAIINSYKLLKSDSINGLFDTLATYPASTGYITYSDELKTSEKIAYYKVIAINDCNIIVKQSNIASNMLLKVTTANSGSKTNVIKWTNYKTWLGGLDNYEIFRSIDGSNFSSIAQVSSSINSFTDDITDLVLPVYHGKQSNGHFCYYIIAYEGQDNPYEISGTSQSNISCVYQETIIWLPNAFNPNSAKAENRTFKPVISFASDYSMIIYSRNGSIVFRATDPLQGWDGKSTSGGLLKQGTYVFLLKYKTKNNKFVEKTGHINLVY